MQRQRAFVFVRFVMLAIASWMAVDSAACRATAAELAEALDAVLDATPAARRSTITLKVVDLETGKTLYNRGGAKLLVPASNLKMYTAACALDLFGPEHQFETKLQARGKFADGVLTGDIVLVGGGDAMLTHEDLAALVQRAVKRWGLRELHGRVRVDNSRYGSPLKGPGWMWDDDPDYYNMSVTPLMVDFNVLKARLAPTAGGAATLQFQPPSVAPPVRIEQAPSSVQVDITRLPFTETIIGRAPAGEFEAVEVQLTMHDPGPWAAGLVRTALEGAGVRVAKQPAAGAEGDKDGGGESLPIVDEIRHPALPLIVTLKHFLNVSENAVGEVLLHEIAIRRGVERPRWRDGAGAITDWLLNTAGLEEGSFRLVDGSGLSRYNLITGDSAVALLGLMRQHKHADEFFAALTKYALDDVTDADEGVVIAAKSGGMTSVSTISGYVYTRGGRMVAFSLLANGFIGSNKPILDLRQKVWRTLAEWAPNEG